MNDENEQLENNESLAVGETEAVKTISSNDYFRKIMDRNFLEYASYVIRNRAIPDVDDGLKPVQRRILWAMHKIDDGRTHKAAFVVGEVMGKYHPHGDASIKDALVVLANKDYFIEKQGNFGNIITGSNAAAARYIECGLNQLSREVLFNDDITPMVDTYDSRNLEPVVLPVKIPSLLMLGSDGIAVGMSTKIMPHNFNELLNAQIAELNGEDFELYPDFLQGGLMDVHEYADGNGKITVRAKIEIDGKKLIIKEIPYTTTTESLIASIERAADKGRIKIASVNDYTADSVEIEIIPTRGYDVEKALQALYMYTDCSVSISANLTVIKENRPTQMSVTEVVKRNTQKLLEYLRAELEIALERQNALFHAKTLAQIFFENRIYKEIEECKNVEEEYKAVYNGLAPFVQKLRREISDDDIDKLLALPVRRIARFDIEKNQRELQEIDNKIAELNKQLKNLTKFAINYLEDLLKKYGEFFPRHTEICTKLEKIDRKRAALSNIKIGWDKKNGYIGRAVKSDDIITCNEFDRLLLVEKSGKYKICNLPPSKLFVGKLYECRKYDPKQEFGIIYSDNKTKKYYGKRTIIDKFITDKEYMLCPDKCKLELLTPRSDAIYEIKESTKRTQNVYDLNLKTLAIRTPKARGMLVTSNMITKITHQRYLTSEELLAFVDNNIEDDENTEITEEITVTSPEENNAVIMPELSKEETQDANIQDDKPEELKDEKEDNISEEKEITEEITVISPEENNAVNTPSLEEEQIQNVTIQDDTTELSKEDKTEVIIEEKEMTEKVTEDFSLENTEKTIKTNNGKVKNDEKRVKSSTTHKEKNNGLSPKMTNTKEEQKQSSKDDDDDLIILQPELF